MMPRLGQYLIALLLIIGSPVSIAQSVPEHISNRPLYDFLEELAIEGVIDLPTVAKPYSRALIAEKLSLAWENQSTLSGRQRYLLEMYLRDFSAELRQLPEKEWLPLMHRALQDSAAFLDISLLPPVFNWNSEDFRLSARPVYGIRYYRNQNGQVRHTWGGATMHAYLGNKWSIWASVRDNYQTNQVLSGPGYLNRNEGGAWKINVQGRAGGDYSEMRAGVAYTWPWGNVSLQKDHLEWGDNHHGANILSGRTPSYPMVKLHLHPAPWIDFHYHHGWLISMVTDSLRSYYPNPGDPYRQVYRNKYIAANLFTFTPFRGYHISVGNSVIYSDQDIYPGYLIPFMFFKSVVHTQTQGVGAHNQNSAMFLNLSARPVRHLHVYGTWFIDEFSFTRIGNPDHLNFTSTKAGFRLSGWPLRDAGLTAEYTFTYPKTFLHRTPSTTYTTNHYNLGHYMLDNATDLYLALNWQPWRGLNLKLSYAEARKGNVVPYVYGVIPDTDPFMKDVVWQNTTLALDASYVLYNNISLFAGYHLADVRGFDVDGRSAADYLSSFTPNLFHGKTRTLTFGMQMGF